MTNQSDIYSTVAPWPSQDDGPEGRLRRGLAIAARVKITKNRLGYKVPSQSGNGSYTVSLEGEPFCTCPDFELTRKPCKHVFAAQIVAERDGEPGGVSPAAPAAEQDDEPEGEPSAAPATKPAALLPTRDWSIYNRAQANEQRHFVTLLRELCDTAPQLPWSGGRPRLPTGDMIFAIALKVYSTMSGRRAMSDIADAHDKGLLKWPPSLASLYKYFDEPP